MSQETKQKINEIKKTFEIIQEGTKHLVKEAEKFDKSLSEKIKKVGDAGEEVVKHIEKKLD